MEVMKTWEMCSSNAHPLPPLYVGQKIAAKTPAHSCFFPLQMLRHCCLPCMKQRSPLISLLLLIQIFVLRHSYSQQELLHLFTLKACNNKGDFYSAVIPFFIKVAS